MQRDSDINYHIFNNKCYIEIDLNESIWDYVKIMDRGYRVLYNIAYFSKRYKRWVRVDFNDWSDGATSAPDIDSFSWIFHDDLCRTGKFHAIGNKSDWNISPPSAFAIDCNNHQASMILHDILKSEKYWLRSKLWYIGTFLFGGGKARDNGLL